MDSIEFEEISVDSSDSPDIPIPRKMKQVRRESLASKMLKLKSNPNTFDYESILKQMKRPVKYSSTSPKVVERLLFTHQLSENKKKFLAQKKEAEEIKKCTFFPKVSSPSPERSFSHFYEQQKRFENKKKEKIEEIKGELEKKKKEDENLNGKTVAMSRGSKVLLVRKEIGIEGGEVDMGDLYKTVSVSKGIFKAMGKPPLPGKII